MNFEEASKKLDEILKKLESGTTLEEGLSLFEEGCALSKVCFDKLEDAKGRLSIIRKTLDSFSEEDMK